MATRTIYLTVRLDIDNPKADEITDEEVDEIISEVDYEFKNYGGYNGLFLNLNLLFLRLFFNIKLEPWKI